MQRRIWTIGLVALLGVVVLGASAGPILGAVTRAGHTAGGTPAGGYYLAIDGAPGGFLKSASIQTSTPTIRFQIAVAGTQPVADWISAVCKGQIPTNKGSIFGLDASLRPVGQMNNFSNALMTEVDFPACDASSKNQGYLTVVLRPDTIQSKPVSATGPINQPKPKMWVQSDFMLNIDGIPMRQVTSVVGVALRQSGGAGMLAPSHFTITVPAASATALNTWWKNQQAGRMQGGPRDAVLDFLGRDMQTRLARISFSRLTLVSVAPVNKAGMVKAVLQCEAMSFTRLARP